MSRIPKSALTSSAPDASRPLLSRRPNWVPFWVALGAVMWMTRGVFLAPTHHISVLSSWAYTPPPLVMTGGDPYVRALMRTISASEANYAQPYSVLYGGRRVNDLSQHPDRCVPITVGPNRGDCTTAAGRYQFLTGTWLEKAEKYHPERSQFWIRNSYRFSPEFQDVVVYQWLMDDDAWNMDIAAELQQGNIDDVLKRLSGTWTSLGYGIETNRTSPLLPKIYEHMLEDELAIATSS